MGVWEGLIFPLFLVQLLHFHPAVLKPDFDLSLAQVKQSGHLVSPVPGQVHIKQKLFLQLQGLILGVGTSLLPGGSGVQPVS